MENANTLQGKTALITGGTTGIGRATLHLLVSKGMKVLFFGTDETHLDDTMNEIKEKGFEEQVMGFIADVSAKENVDFIFQHVDSYLGKLDFLINNAALSAEGLMDTSYEDMAYVVNVNMLGYLSCAQEAAKRMKNNGSGHIINIGSMSAVTKAGDSTVYVATKSGIQGFSESLRKELNPSGIKVTLLEPGAVGTDMQPYTPEEQREKEEKLEMLTAEDIAESVLYILSQPKRCDVVELKIRPHKQII
ncbi:SDR family oxidoreductase [Chitinophaga niabensis]|uniref:NADP-dependent 3-hydroxy acid dehydrogenase YdfG n=1 Tax=Chitinophaga niabensis TaxID=536979 RepID=A0A1N6D3L8_9BACT|nr:SDR family oxidoreductase [Chitinophaga niabensis]SIN65375.1 NADP-dependent 3-hydroxy acid dehydrogenase YdfG [Chitinophaga niabensis]